jgi:diguanylate cyclase (GGDEF)-like protein
VTDLGSTNGTFVNETRVAGASLADGDRVQVGNVLLKYIAGGNVEGAYHEEIQRLMRFDGLTGAANRGHFEDALRTAVVRARHSAQPIGLLLLDLDHFKTVNDTWGHPAGDSVLRQAAELLARGLGSNQLLARVGGEEFAVLWPGADLAAMRHLAEALRISVAEGEWQASGHRIRLTISIGAAARPAGSTDLPGRLYEQADARLYAAKRAGRNCVC